MGKQKWNRDKVLAALATLDRLPREKDLGSRNGLPSLGTVRHYCGSLTQAQRDLGYEPLKQRSNPWTLDEVWRVLRDLDFCPGAKVLNSPKNNLPTVQTVKKLTGMSLSEVQGTLGWCPRPRGAPGHHENYYASCRSPRNDFTAAEAHSHERDYVR